MRLVRSRHLILQQRYFFADIYSFIWSKLIPQNCVDNNVVGFIIMNCINSWTHCNLMVVSASWHTVPPYYRRSAIFTWGQFWPQCVWRCLCVWACVRACACEGQLPPKTIETLTKVFCSFGPNFVILAWTGPELSRGQASDWYTHTHTSPFWACPHHNSLPIQARIAKFGPKVQNSLVKILIVWGGNWPWPSSSNLT